MTCTSQKPKHRPRLSRDDAPTLVRRAQAGEEDALVELMRAYRPLVAATAHQYLDDRHDVEDAIQEVWVALVHDIHRIQSPDRIIGWLRRVSINAALRTRKRTAVLCLQSDPDITMAAESTDETGIANVTRERESRSVREALGRLRPCDRELLELIMETDQPNYRSISSRAGRPVGSIGPTRQRALARLRRDPALAAL
jgi:RNA polymerase sigma factor (sigma-70 family)